MNLSQICDRERKMDKGTPMKIKVKLAASVSQLTDCHGSSPLKLEEEKKTLKKILDQMHNKKRY